MTAKASGVLDEAGLGTIARYGDGHDGEFDPAGERLITPCRRRVG